MGRAIQTLEGIESGNLPSSHAQKKFPSTKKIKAVKRISAINLQQSKIDFVHNVQVTHETCVINKPSRNRLK